MYGAPFVSKLCILLMGRFSTKNRLDFLAAKYRVDFCTTLKISGRFFDRQNIGSIFCTSCKISGRFLTAKNDIASIFEY